MGRRKSCLTSLVNKVNYTAPIGARGLHYVHHSGLGGGEEFFCPGEDGEEEEPLNSLVNKHLEGHGGYTLFISL